MTPAKDLLEDKWMFLHHPFKRGDRVKVKGTEDAGTVTEVFPGCFELRVTLDNGYAYSFPINQLIKVAQ